MMEYNYVPRPLFKSKNTNKTPKMQKKHMDGLLGMIQCVHVTNLK